MAAFARRQADAEAPDRRPDVCEPGGRDAVGALVAAAALAVVQAILLYAAQRYIAESVAGAGIRG